MTSDTPSPPTPWPAAWMLRLSGILGHTKASFTLDTYAHVTGDMQRQAAQVMDTFMTDIFGKELTPWQSGESPAAAAST